MSSSVEIESINDATPQHLKHPKQMHLQQPPGRTYECESWCREASRHIFGALGVLLLAVGYAVVGGFMFSAIETRAALNYKEKHIEMPPAQLLRETPLVMNVTSRPTIEIPLEVKRNLERARKETVAKLWQQTEEMNILYPDNWTRLASMEILWFQDQLTKALLNEFQSIKSQASLQPLDSNQGYRDKDSEEGSEGHQGSDEKSDDSAHDPSSDHKEVWSVVHNPDRQKSGTRLKPEEWSFARGMLYSVSLLSTVGCGSDWAVSPLSRVLTVVFIIIGSPIMYLYLSTVGSLASRAVHTLAFKLGTCSNGEITKSRTCNNRGFQLKNNPHQVTGGSNHHQQQMERYRQAVLQANNRSNLKRSSSSTSTLVDLNEKSNAKWRSKIGRFSEDYEPNIMAVLFGCLCFLVSYVIISGAVVASFQPEWSPAEALYFCFMTFMLVGNGGLDPKSIEESDQSRLWPVVGLLFLNTAVLASILFILRDAILRRLKSGPSSLGGVLQKQASKRKGRFVRSGSSSIDSSMDSLNVKGGGSSSITVSAEIETKKI